jgi:hypothetical protein
VTDNNPKESARYKSIKALYAGPLQQRIILRGQLVARTHPKAPWDNLDRAVTESEGLTVGVVEK